MILSPGLGFEPHQHHLREGENDEGDYEKIRPKAISDDV